MGSVIIFLFLRSVTKRSCAAAHAWGVRWQHVVDRVQTHTPFAVDQHLKMSSVCWTGRSANSCYSGVAHRKQHNLQNAVFYEDRFAKIHVVHAVRIRGRPRLNVVERFRNGSSIHESIARKPAKCAKFILVSCKSYSWNAPIKRSIRSPSKRSSSI